MGTFGFIPARPICRHGSLEQFFSSCSIAMWRTLSSEAKESFSWTCCVSSSKTSWISLSSFSLSCFNSPGVIIVSSSLLYWGCLLRTLVSESSSAFSASWAWLRLDHKTLLQQKVAPVSFNTPSPKSLDSLCSKRVCEQVEMPPELPSIHFAEYLGTGESNCGSNFLSVWCLKLKSWCWDGFELSESESKSLFCAYCMIQLIFFAQDIFYFCIWTFRELWSWTVLICY